MRPICFSVISVKMTARDSDDLLLKDLIDLQTMIGLKCRAYLYNLPCASRGPQLLYA
jgi:hypothetical protein